MLTDCILDRHPRRHHQEKLEEACMAERFRHVRALLFRKPERKSYPCAHHEGVCWNRGIASPIWTSALDGAEWLDSRPGRLTPAESVFVIH